MELIAIIGGGAGLLAGVGGLLTGVANLRESRTTNHKLENGLRSTLERIDARTLRLEAWTELHEAQHLHSN